MKKLNVSERRVVINKLLKEITEPIKKYNDEVNKKYAEKIDKLLKSDKDYKALIGISKRLFKGEEPITHPDYYLKEIAVKIRTCYYAENPKEQLKSGPSHKDVEDALILAQIDCPDLDTLIATLKAQFPQ